MTPSAYRVSVVVLICGAPEVTTACLESLVGLRDVDVQLLVVNNGGGRDIQKTLNDFRDRWGHGLANWRILTNDKNLGACTARNQALAQADGQFIAFLDNDITCPNVNWLRSVIGLLELDETIGLAGPRIVSARPMLPLECAGYAVSAPGQVTPLGAGADRHNPTWRARRIVQAMGNFVARTDTVRAIGGFDPAYDPFGFENIDCCYRVKQLGLKVACDGTADLHHTGHATTGGFSNKGRDILFEKSLLLRRRWVKYFQQEQALFEDLIGIVQAANGEMVQ